VSLPRRLAADPVVALAAFARLGNELLGDAFEPGGDLQGLRERAKRAAAAVA
jgi:hypothetical protein